MQGKRILVFSKTEGFRHSSIPRGQEAIRDLAQAEEWGLTFTEDATLFQSDTLEQYSALVFLSTTGDVLNDAQQAAMEAFIRSGKGFVGIHSASDTEYDWPWYGGLVGAYFDGHPRIQEAAIQRFIDSGLGVENLPSPWIRVDEWYNFRDISPDIQPLLCLDETTYEGGTLDDFHPISWYQAYDGGRSFYTGMGHSEESFSEELFLQHLRNGMRYAVGE